MILQPFPGTVCTAVASLTVEVTRPALLQLQLSFRLTGALDRLRIPDLVSAPSATPNLWQHTCFELFLRAPGAKAYQEYNFSPSLHWDHYRFTHYCQPDVTIGKIAPVLTCHRTHPNELVLTATVPLPTEGPLDLGLTTVIEDTSGTLTYFALTHAVETPDFHDARSFTLRL